jgi:hypothetical protein
MNPLQVEGTFHLVRKPCFRSKTTIIFERYGKTEEDGPQRLKPGRVRCGYGMAEAMP